MEFLLCRNRVADFARWKAVFDSHASGYRAAGLYLAGLWRGVEAPDDVFFLFRVESLVRAREFLDAPDAAEAGRVAGVIGGEYHSLESVQGYGD
jgi:hypothetical protein